MTKRLDFAACEKHARCMMDGELFCAEQDARHFAERWENIADSGCNVCYYRDQAAVYAAEQLRRIATR